MILSLTVVRYRKRYIPFALLAMALHRLPLVMNKECKFWKLMGSGKKGSFDLHPDWQQWALLTVWANQEKAEGFMKKSFISQWWRAFGKENWTILCEPISGHGKWDNEEPFEYSNKEKGYSGPIAVLTRATIRFTRLKAFWAHVDPVADLLQKSPGYILSLGIGEAPIYKQATFSIWESSKALQSFAYETQEHREVIKKTRDENWYSEQLFARFKPVASFGTLNGKNPINL